MMACLFNLCAGIEALRLEFMKLGLLSNLFAEFLSLRVTVTL